MNMFWKKMFYSLETPMLTWPWHQSCHETYSSKACFYEICTCFFCFFLWTFGLKSLSQNLSIWFWMSKCLFLKMENSVLLICDGLCSRVAKCIRSKVDAGQIPAGENIFFLSDFSNAQADRWNTHLKHSHLFQRQVHSIMTFEVIEMSDYE